MSEGLRPTDWIDVALDEAVLRCDELGHIRETRGPAHLLPVAAESLIGRRIADVDTLPAAMRDAWTQALERAGDTQRAQICGYSLERDGATKSFEARCLPVADGATVVAIRDVGERDRLRERVEHLALHDALTGLGNTRTLRERLSRWIVAPPGSSSKAVVLAIVDLDRFRQANDLHGRAIGDSLLRLVAQRMRQEAERHVVGSNDSASDDDVVVVRLGGDQFAVAWRPGADPDTSVGTRAEVLADRLLTALSAPTRIGGRTLFVRASIGIALHPDDARDAASLFVQADAALSRAKQAGRNQFRRHGDDREGGGARVPLQTLSSEAVLRDAIANAEFRLVYQPKFELASSLSVADETQRGPLAPGAVIAVEALCRWRSPAGPLVGPAAFLPLAETTGLVRPLGDWVLRQALSDVARIATRAARVGISVNVSLSQLHDRAFVDFIAAELRAHGVDAAALTLEISETAFVEDLRLVGDALAELSALGVRLAIDHFGVGTAGLVALKSLPVDEIKIDRSFIAGAAIDLFDATIVAGLIELGHNLGMAVTAEGVERVDQIATLAKLRCDAIQGFFVGEPMTADALVADEALWRKTRPPVRS